MIELRPEQLPGCDQAKKILQKHRLVYIAGQIRVGKTPISLVTAYELGWKSVCIITKKQAMPGFKKFNPESIFTKITITTYGMVHHLHQEYDGFIVDEGHNLGKYPIPSKRTEKIKNLIGNSPMILLSGTPTPEGFSQIYHQFWVSNFGPFQRYYNPKLKGSGFYKWAKDYVKQYEYKDLDEDGNDITKFRVKQKFVYGNQVNDYSEAKEAEIKSAIHPYFVYLTQEEAGFTSFVEEEILWIPIDVKIYKLMKILKRDKYYKMKNGDEIIVDTGVRMQSLFHQLSSGTLNITYIEDGKEKHKRHTLDESKAWFIKAKFAGHKLAIFYKFIQEGNILRKVFENHTDDQDMFNNSQEKVFICQMVSGREGVNISTAEDVVMYNIDFSATTYWQIRGRMQERDRKIASKLWWAFSEHGIEKKVYKAVSKKLDYTLSYFVKDLKSWDYEGKQITIQGN